MQLDEDIKIYNSFDGNDFSSYRINNERKGEITTSKLISMHSKKLKDNRERNLYILYGEEVPNALNVRKLLDSDKPFLLLLNSSNKLVCQRKDYEEQKHILPQYIHKKPDLEAEFPEEKVVGEEIKKEGKMKLFDGSKNWFNAHVKYYASQRLTYEYLDQAKEGSGIKAYFWGSSKVASPKKRVGCLRGIFKCELEKGDDFTLTGTGGERLKCRAVDKFSAELWVNTIELSMKGSKEGNNMEKDKLQRDPREIIEDINSLQLLLIYMNEPHISYFVISIHNYRYAIKDIKPKKANLERERIIQKLKSILLSHSPIVNYYGEELIKRTIQEAKKYSLINNSPVTLFDEIDEYIKIRLTEKLELLSGDTKWHEIIDSIEILKLMSNMGWEGPNFQLENLEAMENLKKRGYKLQHRETLYDDLGMLQDEENSNLLQFTPMEDMRIKGSSILLKSQFIYF